MLHSFSIHPDNPQPRLLSQAADILHDGGIVALPTDTCYVLCCRLDHKLAVEKMRRIRGLDDKHPLTLLCHDLSQIAQYAKIENWQYRLLKHATPGPYTIVLEASRELPRRLSHPSRKTIGIRVPDNKIVSALLETLGTALIATTLRLADQTEPLVDVDEIRDALNSHIDLLITGHSTLALTTVIDLTSTVPVLLRQGQGDPAVFGL